jgi:hypothetical protein
LLRNFQIIYLRCCKKEERERREKGGEGGRREEGTLGSIKQCISEELSYCLRSW